MSITVRQLHPLFVGEVWGVDLARPTPDVVALVRDAIDRHAVLVFHGQKLDDSQMLALGHAFGRLSPPRPQRAARRLEHDQIADISNLDASGQLRQSTDHKRLDGLGNQLWHRTPRSGRCPANTRCCMPTSCRRRAARPSSRTCAPPMMRSTTRCRRA